MKYDSVTRISTGVSCNASSSSFGHGKECRFISRVTTLPGTFAYGCQVFNHQGQGIARAPARGPGLAPHPQWRIRLT